MRGERALSLSGIFNPLVRAYFGNKSNESGSSGESESPNLYKTLTIAKQIYNLPLSEMDSFELEGMTLYKVADYVDLFSAVDDSAYFFGVSHAGDKIVGTFQEGFITDGENFFGVLIPDELVEANGAPSSGFYLIDGTVQLFIWCLMWREKNT